MRNAPDDRDGVKKEGKTRQKKAAAARIHEFAKLARKAKRARHYARLPAKKDRRVTRSSHGVYTSVAQLTAHRTNLKADGLCSTVSCPCHRPRD